MEKGIHILIPEKPAKPGSPDIDNRIMYTAGIAAKEMGLLGQDVRIILTIPLTVTGKNPFFDRK